MVDANSAELSRFAPYAVTPVIPGTHIHDNLEIILWAIENSEIQFQRVEEFLLLIDINAARLPVPHELRYASVA